MYFGPWMNSEDELDYVSETSVVTFSGAAQHTQWKLLSAGVVKKVYNVVSKDKKFSSKFPNLIYYFIIERHSSLISKVIGCKLLRPKVDETLKLSLF